MRRIVAAVACLIAFAVLAAAQEKPKAKTDVAGLWLGVLKVGPIDLRLAFQIEKVKDKDEYKATLISIDQDRAKVPCDKVTFAERKLTVELPKIAASYSGTLNEKGTAIDGTFTQLKQKYPLKLDRIDKLPTSNRPQHPKSAVPYLAEDVTFENKKARIELAGTLTMPKGDGPFPAVVLVSGSGPQDRDETIFDHKPFLVLADHLARNGIACLRYDDRGVGKSKGSFAGSTTADFATDAYAAVGYLKGRKKIDAKRIGICGHSEGGAVAPLVASEHPDDVGFIVLLAGPGITGEAISSAQFKDFTKLGGASDEDVPEGAKFQAKLLTAAKAAKTTAEAKEAIAKVVKDFAATVKDEKKRKELEGASDAIVARVSDPWIRWFLAYDPLPVLKKVKCPVLALNGEKDLQVRPGPNLKGIAAALKAGGNKDVTVEELKGLNHLFQTCKTGALSEYGQIEETFAPEAMKKISKWINDRK